MATFNADNIPFLMYCYKQWVRWKHEEVDGRLTKVPYQVNGKKADVTNLTNWGAFEEVYKVADNFSGIGFVFTEESKIMGLDFDHIKKGDEWDPEALQEIQSLNSYAEISPGGDGIHVYVIGKVPGNRNRTKNREMYDKGRFFTVTGNQLPGTPNTVNEAQPAVNALYDKWFTKEKKENQPITQPENNKSDEDIINICKKAKNSEKFERLYAGNIEGFPSQSEADLSLCSMIAFYTQDKEQIDRIFSESALYRPEKWGNRQDYKAATIEKALSGLTNVYTGEKETDRPVRQGVEVPFDVVGNRIMQKFNLMTLDDTKELYLYENGVYKTEGTETKINKEIREEYTQVFVEEWNEKIGTDLPEHLPVANSSYIREVKDYIKDYTAKRRSEITKGQEHLINLKNGIFNTHTWELEPHDPSKYMIRQIPVIYNPKAKCPQILEFLSNVVSEENARVLVEFAGYALIPDTKMQKALLLYGSSFNGKSKFIELLTAFIGEENTSNEKLHTLETDRFSVSNLHGKLLNIYPDISDECIYHNDTFKTLVGGDRMRGEKKYSQAFSFKNTARLIFSANKIPAVKDDTRAFFRRWILINFPNVFEGDKEDKNLLSKLTTEEELSGFLNLALEGLKRVLTNEKFSYSSSVEEVERLYKINSSPVEAFADRCLVASHNNTGKAKIWEAFTEWAKNNGVKALPFNKFCGAMKKIGYTDKRNWKDGHESRESFWENVSIKEGQVDEEEPVPQKEEREPFGTGIHGLNPYCSKVKVKQLN